MKVLVIAGLLVAATNALFLKEEGNQFQAFKLQHGKIYKDQEEETRRFNIFKENLRAIEEHNARYEQGLVSYKQGVTKFADMTQEEFKAWLTLRSSKKPNINTAKYVKSGLKNPISVDWRGKGQVTEVKDQGRCGSCWAFSITGSTEAAYYRKSGKLVSLSEQQLVDCSTEINDGCGGGYLDETFPYVQQYGLESEATYPYIGINDSCKYSSSDVVTRISGYNTIEFKDENALLDAVANVGPVSVGMDATFLSLYKYGIYEDSRCHPVYINHAVLIVGYGSENGTDYWIAKNSWGKIFGEQGYFRIKRGTDECGISEDAVFPTSN